MHKGLVIKIENQLVRVQLDGLRQKSQQFAFV